MMESESVNLLELVGGRGVYTGRIARVVRRVFG